MIGDLNLLLYNKLNQQTNILFNGLDCVLHA